MKFFDLIPVISTGVARRHEEELWHALQTGNVREVAQQMFPRNALETSATPHSSGDRQHGRKSAMRGAQERPEECSPCDDARTASVVDLCEDCNDTGEVEKSIDGCDVMVECVCRQRRREI